ncbi:MAG: histidine kinase [Bacteroidota bacterium]|nr:histidine kinase [Bacteroidota bacterium]
MIDIQFFVATDNNSYDAFHIHESKQYIYPVQNRHKTMLIKRYIFYILFLLAYTGALILQKPDYSVNGSWLSYLPTFLVHFFLLILVIILHNAVLVPRLLEKKHRILYIVGVAVLIVLYAVIAGWYNKYIRSFLFHNDSRGTVSELRENIIYAACFIIISSMLYITQKWSEQREQVKNIEISQLQTELKYLRSQINPHFLFNGLNTIYGSIDMNNQEARNMMLQFSNLLRYNLYEADVDSIQLRKEADYLQNYVALQKARSNDNMHVTLKINYKNSETKIAPLIFMAFAENAFKHASRDDDANNSISIELNEEDGRIEFTCENTFDDAEPTSSGIGLGNAIRRLELLYKDHHNLSIKKEQNIYKVNLTLIS